jgi:hypothetical protein
MNPIYQLNVEADKYLCMSYNKYNNIRKKMSLRVKNDITQKPKLIEFIHKNPDYELFRQGEAIENTTNSNTIAMHYEKIKDLTESALITKEKRIQYKHLRELTAVTRLEEHTKRMTEAINNKIPNKEKKRLLRKERNLKYVAEQKARQEQVRKLRQQNKKTN